MRKGGAYDLPFLISVFAVEFGMKIALDEKEIEVGENALIFDVLKENLSGKKFKTCIAAKINGETLLDLSQTVPAHTTAITPVTADSEEGLQILRHSVSHIMAQAVQKLFPNTKVTIGPSIENGFYYDFDAERPFTPADFENIEKEMHAIAERNLPFERSVMSKNDAIEFFKKKGELYKAEIISEIEADTVSLYKQGDFIDLCRGPHIPNTSFASF